MTEPNQTVVDANTLVNAALIEAETDQASANTMLEQAATLYENAGLPDEAADARDLQK